MLKGGGNGDNTKFGENLKKIQGVMAGVLKQIESIKRQQSIGYNI